jgi:subtilisin family serine protease
VAALRADPQVAAVVPDRTFTIDAQTLPTGIDLDDPDLNARNGTNCVSPGAPAEDDNGHGTHVAGTTAARDNDLGVVGVAPGARVWAVKVLNAAGSGTTSQIVCGIDWVTANAHSGAGIELANMSLGGQSPLGAFSTCNSSWDPMHQAICRSVGTGHLPGRPGRHLRRLLQLRRRRGRRLRDPERDLDGHPHVTGAAGLYRSTHPSATPAQVKTALQQAGNLNWNDADDPDSTKERLLNVDTL